jgi:hypothetical protein
MAHPPGTTISVELQRPARSLKFRVGDAFTRSGAPDEHPAHILTSVDENRTLEWHGETTALHDGLQQYEEFFIFSDSGTANSLPSSISKSTAISGWTVINRSPTYFALAGAHHPVRGSSTLGRRDIIEVVKYGEAAWRYRIGTRQEDDWSPSWTYQSDYETRSEALESALDWVSDHPVSPEAARRSDSE